MTSFTTIFGIALIINIGATIRSSNYWPKISAKLFGQTVNSNNEGDESLLAKNDDINNPALISKHAELLKKYLCVYLLAALSDWLQGPYVYALYDEYGYSQHEIAVLFVAGFGSSMVFGTFIGGLADSCGRRKFTILFAVVYIASCMTKHFKDFNVLMLGRLLGGVCTSLLFSVFDSWLIKSHADAGVSAFLSKSFAAAQYGNSIVAILAGLAANKAAGSTKMTPLVEAKGDETALMWKGGYLNPFDMAIFVLVIASILTVFTWEENFGERKVDTPASAKKQKWYAGFTSALYTTVHNKEILYAGLICSLFEGSMYIFVFMWSPAMMKLSEEGESLPFGLIFATFMVCCMAGSSLFSVAINSVKVEKLGVYIFGVATCSFLMMAVTTTSTTKFVAFLLFETTVGVYFPTMGTMKSVIVPESKRSAIYNIYRVPLNCIVLFSLLTNLTPEQSFYLCTIMLACATGLQMLLIKHQNTFFTTSAATKEEPSDLELGVESSEPKEMEPLVEAEGAVVEVGDESKES